jgi:hypothetical protein
LKSIATGHTEVSTHKRRDLEPREDDIKLKQEILVRALLAFDGAVYLRGAKCESLLEIGIHAYSKLEVLSS